MLRATHLRQIWQVWPFLIVLLAGVLVYWADYVEVSSAATREMVLLAVSLTKSLWFIRFVILQIRASTHQTFYFHEFMVFIGTSVLLFILSFAIDYYCLLQISPNAFRGFESEPHLTQDFLTCIYFSVTTFTTAGLGDIVPNSSTARSFTTFELIISFFFTIFIIANLAVLRESFAQKKA
jgi:Ion channel